MSTREQFLDSLKQAGEEAVRERYNTGGYGENRLVVQEFLRKFEDARNAEKDLRADSAVQEELRIARSAKNAAWLAAGAAIIAIIISIVALVISTHPRLGTGGAG